MHRPTALSCFNTLLQSNTVPHHWPTLHCFTAELRCTLLADVLPLATLLSAPLDGMRDRGVQPEELLDAPSKSDTSSSTPGPPLQNGTIKRDGMMYGKSTSIRSVRALQSLQFVLPVFVGPSGPRGPRRPRGPRGPSGPRGPRGPVLLTKRTSGHQPSWSSCYYKLKHTTFAGMEVATSATGTGIQATRSEQTPEFSNKRTQPNWK